MNQFVSYVIVGRSREHVLWRWNSWKRTSDQLEPIIQLCSHPVAVRPVQGKRGEKNNVRFGRLGWNDKSHQAWTHGSPANREQCGAWRFCNSEIWSPSWSMCERTQRAPDLFIMIENPFLTRTPKTDQFNQFFHIAVTEQMHQRAQSELRFAIKAISEYTEKVLVLTRKSPWNLRGDSVQSCLNNLVHYIGMHEDLIPNPAKMRTNWTHYEPGSPLPKLADLPDPVSVWDSLAGKTK